MREILVLFMTSLSVRPYVRMQHFMTTNANGTLKYVEPVLPPLEFLVRSCMDNCVLEKQGHILNTTTSDHLKNGPNQVQVS